MASLIDRVLNLQGKKLEEDELTKVNVRKNLIEIAIRDQAGKSKDSDVQRLCRVLEFLEITDDDYRKIVNGVARVANAAASVEYHGDAMSGYTERFIESQRQMHIIQGELKRAQRRVHELQRVESARRESVLRLNCVSKEFPELLKDGAPHPSLRPLIDGYKEEIERHATVAERASDEMINQQVSHTLERLGLLRREP